MKNFINKLKNAIFQHKIRSFIILMIVIAGGYFGYQKFHPTATTVQYVTEAAANTTLTVSVTGSGQVSDLNRIDLKPAAGTSNVTITNTKVKKGDLVKAGQVIATVDQKNTAAAVRQAQASVASARASYDKLIAGTTKLDLEISAKSVAQAEQNYNNALTSLELTKKTTAESIAQAEENLRELLATDATVAKRDTVISTIQDKLSAAKTSLDSENKIITDNKDVDVFSAKNPTAFTNAKFAYDQALPLLDKANQSLTIATFNKTDANINKAVVDAKMALSRIAYSLNNLYNAAQNSVASNQLSQTQIDSYKSTASGGEVNMNAGINSVQAAWQNLTDAITNAADSKTNAENSLTSAKLSAESQLNSAQNQIRSSYNSWQSAKDQLAKLKIPADAQEIASAKAQITNALVQLEQAQNNFENTIITAPFDGVVAVFDIQKGDQVSASTIIATIITKNKIAIIPFNEVDASRIAISDKVILTFDAIDGLSMTGKVAELDALGTISQGVVTYNAKISFDTQDDRIKTDMSVNTEVITNVKTDVLAVPNGAIKTDNNGAAYVQMLNENSQPYNISVETGITNDTMTEITQGLEEGDKVVVQTITTGATNTTTQGAQGGNIRLPGIGGGFGR